MAQEDQQARDAFQARVDALVGQPMGQPAKAPDPVNLAMIRHWVAAFDDRNPIYLDDGAAAAAGHGSIVAPPMMLQAWTMPTPVLEGIGERGGSPVPATEESIVDVFDQAGFVATLAAGSEFEVDRYLHLDEHLTSENHLESISPEKQTRVGRGHFITWVTTFRDDAGEAVGRQRFRIFKFKPGEGVA